MLIRGRSAAVLEALDHGTKDVPIGDDAQG
jgi:hypothetical protein